MDVHNSSLQILRLTIPQGLAHACTMMFMDSTLKEPQSILQDLSTMSHSISFILTWINHRVLQYCGQGRCWVTKACDYTDEMSSSPLHGPTLRTIYLELASETPGESFCCFRIMSSGNQRELPGVHLYFPFLDHVTWKPKEVARYPSKNESPTKLHRDQTVDSGVQ